MKIIINKNQWNEIIEQYIVDDNDVKNGLWTAYTGKKSYESCNFENGVRHGVYNRTNWRGELVDACLYVNGEIHDARQVQFTKVIDSKSRSIIAKEIVTARKNNDKKSAMLIAKRFHAENTFFKRYTALKFDNQRD